MAGSSFSKTYTSDGTSSALGARDVARIAGSPREFSMLDILMLTLGLGFFVLSVGYAYACERL